MKQDYVLSQDLVKRIKIVIEKNELVPSEKRERFIYALLEIRESSSKLFNEIIPPLESLEESSNLEQIKDAFWDIREEVRHIQYHIDDGNLCENDTD
jgi:hypothetical protein